MRSSWLSKFGSAFNITTANNYKKNIDITSSIFLQYIFNWITEQHWDISKNTSIPQRPQFHWTIEPLVHHKDTLSGHLKHSIVSRSMEITDKKTVRTLSVLSQWATSALRRTFSNLRAQCFQPNWVFEHVVLWRTLLENWVNAAVNSIECPWAFGVPPWKQCALARTTTSLATTPSQPFACTITTIPLVWTRTTTPT